MGETYDSKVGWDEAVMGIPLLRWSLAALATGKVRLWTGNTATAQHRACHAKLLQDHAMPMCKSAAYLRKKVLVANTLLVGNSERSLYLAQIQLLALVDTHVHNNKIRGHIGDKLTDTCSERNS
jgi:hypothetical protein